MSNDFPGGRPSGSGAEASDSFIEDEIDLADYLAIIIESKWLIAITAGVIFLAGLSYALLATPIFSADALVQVEQEGKGIGPLEDLNTALTGETPAEAEIEIIRSRSVVGKAVKQLKLDISSSPHYFPFFGQSFARSHDGSEPAAALWGLNSFAWGGERLQIDRLTVPKYLEGKDLTLVAGMVGKYRLLDPDGKEITQGTVGKTASVRLSSPETGEKRVDIYISELVARPGTRFDIMKHSWLQTVADLQTVLAVSEKGRKTGILELSMQNADPQQAMVIINAITNVYLRQNVERKSAEAEKTLKFLNTQLPKLRTELDVAEENLNEYRAKHGSIDLNLEMQSMLDKGAELETLISGLLLERAELKQRFRAEHPKLQALESKLTRLRSKESRLNKKVQLLPETQQDLLKLRRNSLVKTQLYTLLLNKSQELKVVKAGTVGNVRIIDYAVEPEKPVKPKKSLIAALSLVCGLILGVLLAFVRKSLQQGVEDPGEIERKLGLPTFAILPRSEKQFELSALLQKKSKEHSILALHDRKDPTIESLRSLRTNLHFALMEAENNIVAISGPSPSVGKSFVSVNFAHVLGDSGKKVLLVDGDLRKGHLHQYFGMARSPGLSEIVSGQVKPSDAIRRTSDANVSFLTTGALPPNPSELLMNENFRNLIIAASKQFDLVLIDTPPILAVTDAALIGSIAGTTFLLVRHGVNPIREIDLANKRLAQSNIKVEGIIYNDIQRRQGHYGYGKYARYGTYQYEYK
ncbi:MAG: polysaccharide biosynthesis tyrosine autokinase [Mariprofundaceae bacterium]